MSLKRLCKPTAPPLSPAVSWACALCVSMWLLHLSSERSTISPPHSLTPGASGRLDVTPDVCLCQAESMYQGPLPLHITHPSPALFPAGQALVPNNLRSFSSYGSLHFKEKFLKRKTSKSQWIPWGRCVIRWVGGTGDFRWGLPSTLKLHHGTQAALPLSGCLGSRSWTQGRSAGGSCTRGLPLTPSQRAVW